MVNPYDPSGVKRYVENKIAQERRMKYIDEQIQRFKDMNGHINPYDLNHVHHIRDIMDKSKHIR